MKTNSLILVLIFWGVLAKDETNDIPTFIISAEDVVASNISVYKLPSLPLSGTNRVTVKFQYTETGSNRARAFTESHQNQKVRDRIGEFMTPPVLLQFTNKSGRNGYYGISEQGANAIVDALKKK